MKNFKDFMYDKNDVFIALAILVIAGLLIFWRMNVIMDYPSTLITDNVKTTDTPAASSSTTDKNTTDTAIKPDTQAGTSSANNSDGTNNIWTNGTLIKDITIDIKGGSATSAVQCLIDKGIFDSYTQFENTCTAAGYKPEDIKAGNFTFKSGATKTDIAHSVTK